MRYLLLILGCLFPGLSQAQNQFPDSWEGIWEGMLNIYNQNKLVDSVQMNFEVHPTENDSIWVWKATYETDIPDAEKDYLLVLVDGESGEYAIDEQDGIILRAWLSGNTLSSMFRVNETVLLTRYEKYGDQIHFEVIYGEEPLEDDGVSSGLIGGRQRADLKRVP